MTPLITGLLVRLLAYQVLLHLFWAYSSGCPSFRNLRHIAIRKDIIDPFAKRTEEGQVR